jgi:hypothetical protein
VNVPPTKLELEPESVTDTLANKFVVVVFIVLKLLVVVTVAEAPPVKVEPEAAPIPT